MQEVRQVIKTLCFIAAVPFVLVGVLVFIAAITIIYVGFLVASLSVETANDDLYKFIQEVANGA